MPKAFVCVDHSKLLRKSQIYGIQGNAYNLFKNYLVNRSYVTQKVMFNGVLSDNTCSIECGVPQGSILSPLLYLIHDNDLIASLNHNIQFYMQMIQN